MGMEGVVIFVFWLFVVSCPKQVATKRKDRSLFGLVFDRPKQHIS